MSQAEPSLPVTGEITITASTRSQQRGSHGAFRYFGKLAPDVTGAVLDAAAEMTEISGPVVDLMCGSGTTLIEASQRGWASIGCDVNPVARLYSRVKTRPINPARFREGLDQVLQRGSATPDETALVFGHTRNAERWFRPESMAELATLRLGVSALPESPEAEALLAAQLSRVRRSSNASARTGRIFFDPNSAENVRVGFRSAAIDLLDRLPTKPLRVSVVDDDARRTRIQDNSTELTFCHPPYFALYRYSSDVLRFELEVGGFSRRDTNRREVREGWKSGDPANLDTYVGDMAAVFVEARRITRPGGVFALVASNSTLGDVQLPVIDRLAAAMGQSGWKIEEHLRRVVHFGSARYHRSARLDKVVQQDHVLLAR